MRRDQPLLRGISGWVAKLRALFHPGLLLLIQETGTLTGVVAQQEGKKQGKTQWQFSAPVTSDLADFAHALDEVLSHLRLAGIKAPRHCLIASRLIVAARVDFPVDPESPRPPLQMREMASAEMESVVAEFGAQWTIGAVLQARGLITAEARERIVLELAVRREQSTTPTAPTCFGQVACDLKLVTAQALEESLHLQEKLQRLESGLACGWAGYAEEAGHAPVWLASATGISTFSHFETACKRHKLKLTGALPILWTASETPDETERRIALEIHGEDVVAVLRHRGRVAASRSEGRMERTLAVDWLARMVDDWRGSGIHDLEMVCLEAQNDAALTALLEKFEQHWGKPPLLRDGRATRQKLLETMVRQYQARLPRLPIIRFGNPQKKWWKRPAFWQLCAPMLTLCLVGGVEIQQRLAMKTIQTRFAQNDLETKKQAQAQQQEAKFNQEQQQANKLLEESRQEIVRMIPEIERLLAIEGMVNHLPQLLRTLAQNIGNDVVLEAVRNSHAGGDIGHIQVVGWSPDYGSAQSFALRTQDALSGMGYVVAQTDVKAAPGRDEKQGYQVSFWLMPVAEELDIGEETP
ncbi:hypothetical protein AGMMS49545_01160 [Betaproteobacteria bacterium]|nr:hypothetical protein AGMMS49545_01160 [Betaproteobacteria bacterium]